MNRFPSCKVFGLKYWDSDLNPRRIGSENLLTLGGYYQTLSQLHLESVPSQAVMLIGIPLGAIVTR